MDCWRGSWDRRTFFGILGVGLATVMNGYGSRPAGTVLAAQQPSTDPSAPPAPPGDTQDKSVVLRQGPQGTQQIALTVDDGYCTDCVTGYVAFAQNTGIHITFSPNGTYNHTWAPHAPVLRPLIEAGQVQIINHTFSHPYLTRISASRIQTELEQNEQWIIQNFGTTARPYFRPPYGAHNPAVDDVAAKTGFNRVVLWNGTLGDTTTVSPEFLMSQARQYMNPGTIMLGHANHPTVLGLFDELMQLIRDRALQPVTLDEMFGTRRPPAPS